MVLYPQPRKEPEHDNPTHYNDSGAKKKRRQKISFPFPSILRSLSDPFRAVLKTRACATERIANRLACTPRRACDGIADTSPGSSCHSTHGTGDTAECVSKCGGDEFGGSGDAFVLIWFDRHGGLIEFGRIEWIQRDFLESRNEREGMRCRGL